MTTLVTTSTSSFGRCALRKVSGRTKSRNRGTLPPTLPTHAPPQSVSKSGAADTAKIVADILAFLPSFNNSHPTRHGNELVSMLLARAGSALREDLARAQPCKPRPVPRVPRTARPSVPHKRRSVADVAPPVLLHVLSHGKMTLGRLARESCAFFIASLAGALAACSRQKRPESSELASICRQVVDALSVILPCVFPFCVTVRSSPFVASDAQACL